MKKILSVFVCFIVIFSVTGCFNKTKIDGKTFREKMEGKGFNVVETGDTDDSPEITYIAQDQNGRYQIEFYDIKSKDSAKEKFKSYKSGIDNENTTNRKTSSVSTGNYEKYTLDNGKTYYLASRIDNTMIFLSVDPEYKSDVNKIIKELGY